MSGICNKILTLHCRTEQPMIGHNCHMTNILYITILLAQTCRTLLCIGTDDLTTLAPQRIHAFTLQAPRFRQLPETALFHCHKYVPVTHTTAMTFTVHTENMGWVAARGTPHQCRSQLKQRTWGGLQPETQHSNPMQLELGHTPTPQHDVSTRPHIPAQFSLLHWGAFWGEACR
jgi:hypothetical protein